VTLSINGLEIFTPKKNPLDEMTSEELEAALHLDIEKKQEESIEKVMFNAADSLVYGR
jgi:hypothetical protein